MSRWTGRQTMTHFSILMQVHTLLTQKLVAVDALTASLPVFPAHKFADVAEGKLARLLSGHNLAKAGHQEVVRQLLHATNRKLSPLTAKRARELTIVRVLR